MLGVALARHAAALDVVHGATGLLDSEEASLGPGPATLHLGIPDTPGVDFLR
jgi:hypothetical protein